MCLFLLIKILLDIKTSTALIINMWLLKSKYGSHKHSYIAYFLFLVLITFLSNCSKDNDVNIEISPQTTTTNSATNSNPEKQNGNAVSPPTTTTNSETNNIPVNPPLVINTPTNNIPETPVNPLNPPLSINTPTNNIPETPINPLNPPTTTPISATNNIPVTSIITPSVISDSPYKVYDCPREILPNNIKYLCNSDPQKMHWGGSACNDDTTTKLDFLNSPLSSAIAVNLIAQIPDAELTKSNPQNNILNIDGDGDSMITLKGTSSNSILFDYSSSDLNTLWFAPQRVKYDSTSNFIHPFINLDKIGSGTVFFPLEDKIINVCLNVRHPNEGVIVRVTKKVFIPSVSPTMSLKLGSENKQYKLAFKETFNYDKFEHNFWNREYDLKPKFNNNNEKTEYLKTFKIYGDNDFKSWTDNVNQIVKGNNGGLLLSTNLFDTHSSPDGKETWSDEKILDYMKYLPQPGFGVETGKIKFKDYYIKVKMKPPLTPLPSRLRTTFVYTITTEIIDPTSGELRNYKLPNEGNEIDAIEYLADSNYNYCLPSAGIFYDLTASRKRFEGGIMDYSDQSKFDATNSNFNNYCTEEAYNDANPFLTLEWINTENRVELYQTIGKNPRKERLAISKNDMVCVRRDLSKTPNVSLPTPTNRYTCPLGTNGGTSVKFPGGTSRLNSLKFGFGFWTWTGYNPSTFSTIPSLWTVEKIKNWFKEKVLFNSVEIWLPVDNYYESYSIDKNRYLVKEYQKAKGL